MVTYLMLQAFLQGLNELFFPDNCLVCRRFLNSSHQRQLCPLCLAAIKHNHPPFCLRCSRNLIKPTVEGICPTCLKTNYAFDQAWGCCSYTEGLPKLLHQFKYTNKTALAKTFHLLMTEFIDQYHVNLEQFDLICPIPLHATRLRERGYNQVELLSAPLSVHYHIAHAPSLLERTRYTETQTHFEAKQRWTNVDGAFKIKHSSAVADKSILIIDDLLTTGATANAAALALKEAGAAQVGVLTLGITP